MYDTGPAGTKKYTFTAGDLLVSVGWASLAYDPMNCLYRQVASDTIWRYAGEDMVIELACTMAAGAF